MAVFALFYVSRFGTVPACDEQADGRTHDDSIYRTSSASRSKKSTERGRR